MGYITTDILRTPSHIKEVIVSATVRTATAQGSRSLSAMLRPTVFGDPAARCSLYCYYHRHIHHLV